MSARKYVNLIFNHQLAEMYTNSNMTGSYSGIYSNGGLLEAADQCAGTNYGGSTYCVGTQTLAVSFIFKHLTQIVLI